MTTQQASAPASIEKSQPKRDRRGWLTAAGLILLSLVPIAAGAMRVTELAVGAEITEGNARFFDSPVPVIAHIVGATVFCLLGAFQFVPGLRRGRPSWHRIAGRILVPAGLVAASTGMWMAVFYPRPLLDTIVRLVFGALMFACIVVAFSAVRRRDFGTHRAWMIRGYAIGIGAGTQVLTAVAWLALAGGTDPGPTGTVALLAAAWVINLAVAEFAIRRAVRSSRASAAVRTVST